MSSYAHHTRNLISTWFSLIFILLLASYLAFIEIFHESNKQASIITLLKTPIRSDIIDNVIAMRFKNRIGSYTIKKQDDSWILQEPRVIPAQKRTVNLILRSLRSIKVHTIHEYEPINFQSFSLDNPIINIDLITKLDETIKVTVGLINPINETSYITVSGKKQIFQTNLFEGQLERLELSDFIDGKVFSMDPKDIKRFSLYSGNNKSPLHVLEFKNNNWISSKYNTISNQSTEKKINKILNVNTHMILDEIDDELRQFLDNYTQNPRYRINVLLNNGESVNYNLSNLIREIKSLKIPKRQFFVMTASDRPYPYIISKKFLEEFIIRYSDLR